MLDAWNYSSKKNPDNDDILQDLCCVAAVSVLASWIRSTDLNGLIGNINISVDVWHTWSVTPMELSKKLIWLQKCDKKKVSNQWNYPKSIETLVGAWCVWTYDIRNGNMSVDVWRKWSVSPMELSKMLRGLQKSDKNEASHQWKYPKMYWSSCWVLMLLKLWSEKC